MIPGPWVALVLTLGAFRLTRLAGWDTFPPVARARAWLTGEHVVHSTSANMAMGVTGELPGYEYRYRRRLLAELLHCAFCAGFWVALAAYLAWRFEPRWTLYLLAPFALSAAVGLIARNLDP